MTTSKILKRLDELIAEVKGIPEKITDLNEEDLALEKRRVDEIIMRVRAFIKVTLKDEKYLQPLINLKFLTHEYDGFVYNSKHYMNDEAWKKGKLSFLTLLLNISFELKEKLSMEGNFLSQRENIRYVLFFGVTTVGLFAIFTTNILDLYFLDNRIGWGKLSVAIILLSLTSIIVLPKQWATLLGFTVAALFGLFTILK